MSRVGLAKDWAQVVAVAVEFGVRFRTRVYTVRAILPAFPMSLPLAPSPYPQHLAGDFFLLHLLGCLRCEPSGKCCGLHVCFSFMVSFSFMLSFRSCVASGTGLSLGKVVIRL